MKTQPWVIRSYRFAHTILIGWMIVLALLGLYSAVSISHMPHLVFKRIAILIFYFVLLAQGLMGTGYFVRTWKIGLFVSLLAIGCFIRYQIFPFHFELDASNKVTSKVRYELFKETNTVGNGSRIGEWESNNRPIWYMTMGDSEVLPLLFSLGLPMSLMVFIIVLRKNGDSFTGPRA